MKKNAFASVLDFLGLVWTNLTVKVRNLIDFVKVIFRYYSHWSFCKADLALLLSYLFDNPYTISKRFLMNKGEENVYAYGETPLTTLEYIAEECQIKPSDTVFELGCGRGRGCFWLRAFIKCKVVGLEYVPDFVERALRVKKKFSVEGIEFYQKDILEADYASATVIYMYGTCFEAEFIQELIGRFKGLRSGTKIITVSYPLTDYMEEPIFEVMKRFPARFTWGEADVYLQIKK